MLVVLLLFGGVPFLGEGENGRMVPLAQNSRGRGWRVDNRATLHWVWGDAEQSHILCFLGSSRQKEAYRAR